MTNAFRFLGLLSLLTFGLSGLAALGGCGANKSSGLHRDAGIGDGGAGGATGANADGAAGQSSGGERADGAAPDSTVMGGPSDVATGTGSADAAGVGDAGGPAGFDARTTDMGGRADAGSGGKDAAGSGDAGGAGAGGTGGVGTGGAGGTRAGGTGGGGSGAGGSSAPPCPSDLPIGLDATFCVGRSLYEGISSCHDGGCTCVGGRHVTCLNDCVKNAANSGGTCSGGFLSCPQQGGSTRRSICFLGAVYSVASACSSTGGCNCKISPSQLCTGACVELSDGSAECHPIPDALRLGGQQLPS